MTILKVVGSRHQDFNEAKEIMKFFKNIRQFVNLKKVAIFSPLFVVLMFLTTHFANAFFFDGIAGSVVSFVIGWFLYILGFIAGICFQIVGYLVAVALNVNLLITSSTNTVVRTGWDIILNITNLGFVLAIIIISFATILQFENYAIKKTLWKLIVAALLVNFSLTISGAFIDVANNATQFMMNKSGVSGSVSNTFSGAMQWSSAIGGMFQPQTLLETSKISASGSNNADDVSTRVKGVINGAFGAMLTAIGSMLFIAVFTFIASIAFLTVGILLFMRYVILSFLLMFSPIIWLAWIFPDTKTYWQMWWKKFIKWTLFAPVMIFFMYLALRVMQGIRSSAMTPSPSNDFNPGLTFGLDKIGQMVIVIGLIMGGMYIANLMGIEGANVIYGAASKYSKGWAYRGGQRVMSSKPMATTQGFLNNTLGKVPLLRAIPRGLNRLGVTTEEGAVGAMSSYRNYVKGLKGDRLKNELSTQSGRKLNIGLEEAAKAGNLDPEWENVNQKLMDPKKMADMEKSFKAQKLDIKPVQAALGFQNSTTLQLIKELKEMRDKAGSDTGVFDPLKAIEYAAEQQSLKDKIVEEQSKMLEKASPDAIGKSKMAGEFYKDNPKFEAVLGDNTAKLLADSFAAALIKSNRVGGAYKLFPNMGGSEVRKFAKMISNAAKGTSHEDEITGAINKAMSKRFYGEEKIDKPDASAGGSDKGGDKGGKK